jgi:hypothetical protein
MIDALTLGESHELIEAATDPFGGGYYVDSDHYAILPFAASGEIGDLCEFSEVWLKPADFPYAVTRAWSNAAAQAGHAPCVPAQVAVPYFNAAPVLSDDVAFRYAGIDLTTKGVNIPVGGSKTVEIDLYSEAATSGPWTVTARDAASLRQKPATLAFMFDRRSGRNGDKLHLTIRVLAQDPDYDAEPFLVASMLGSTIHYTFGVVGH